MSIDPETGEILPDAEEAGQTLENMDIDVLDPSLKGTETQMDFNLGSSYEVRQSTLKVPMITKNVTGQFADGDRVKLLVEVEVEDFNFKPITDRTGNKLGVERIHKAVVIDVRPAE